MKSDVLIVAIGAAAGALFLVPPLVGGVKTKSTLVNFAIVGGGALLGVVLAQAILK